MDMHTYGGMAHTVWATMSFINQLYVCDANLVKVSSKWHVNDSIYTNLSWLFALKQKRQTCAWINTKKVAGPYASGRKIRFERRPRPFADNLPPSHAASNLARVSCSQVCKSTKTTKPIPPIILPSSNRSTRPRRIKTGLPVNGSAFRHTQV